MTKPLTKDQWVALYKARMVDRGYPEDRMLAAIESLDSTCLTQDPRDAADDEMFEWDNSEDSHAIR